jgi:hypothetical protein
MASKAAIIGSTDATERDTASPTQSYSKEIAEQSRIDFHTPYHV